MFLFSSLQGESAHLVVPQEDITQLTSIVLLKNGQIYRKTDAVLEIMRSLGGPLKTVSYLLAPIPSKMRDLAYDAVASNRYKLFGRRETCRIPTPEERARFID